MPYPTDESLTGRAEVAGAKKKKALAGAMGPPTIAPPIMDDWAANVRNMQSGATTPSGRGVGGEAPTPSPSGLTDNASMAKSIALRKAPAAQRTELGQMDTDTIRRMQTVDALMRSPGITPEQKAALQAERLNLVSSRREIGGDMDLLNRSMVAPTPAQTPGQIVAGRDQINDALRKELIRQSGPPTGTEADYFVGDEADKVLPRYGGGTGAARGLEDPRVTAIAQAQKQRFLREQKTQSDLGQIVDERADMRSAALAEQMKRRALASRLGTAEGERALAETEGATAQARFSADPKTMESELAAKQAIAKSQAMKAQAESNAYAGAGPTAGSAAVTVQRRNAALAMVGLDNRDSYNEFLQAAESQLGGLDSGRTADEAAKTFSATTLSVLEELAGYDKSAAAHLARQLLGKVQDESPSLSNLFGVGQSPLAGGALGATMLGGTAVGLRKKYLVRKAVRERLEAIAGGSS